MIYLSNESIKNIKLGNKAEQLARLLKIGFAVPNGFILTDKEEVSTYSKVEFERAIEAIGGYPVAVRSSGALEDMAGASFAGLYETILEVSNINELIIAIGECFKSASSDRVINYLAKKSISVTECELNGQLSVLIQKQIHSKVSGVLFNIDPLSGKEEDTLVECCFGLGEKLVSGLVSPTRYVFNNQTRDVVRREPGAENVELTSAMIEDLLTESASIQREYGTAQDIEWAFDQNNKLWILQTRPITSIKWRTDLDEFTNADLKDGGISSKICTPLMFSLYELAMVSSMKNYFHNIKLIDKENEQNWFVYHYGRGYWNSGVIKRALYKIPGFSEKNFDQDLGIQKKYPENGEGHKTSTNPVTILRAIPILLALNREFENCEIMIEKFKSEFNQTDLFWKEKVSKFSGTEIKVIKNDFIDMINNYYFTTESSYFRVVYNNSNFQSMYKEFIDKLKESFGESSINTLNLLGGLEDVSHLEVQFGLEKLCESAQANGMESEAWKMDLNEFLSIHYHHSDSELDLMVPRWGEVPSRVEEMVVTYLEAKINPAGNIKKNELFKIEYQKVLDLISNSFLSKLLNKNKFIKMTDKMRRFLINREQMREFSTRSYYIVRLYILELGNAFVKEGRILEKEDVFYLYVNELMSMCHDSKDYLETVVSRKNQFKAFRNFNAPNEFGSGIMADTKTKTSVVDGKKTFSGVGCSAGTYEGVARVIFSPQDITQIKEGEILVTKFTDPGWTPVLGAVQGVVTEVGGVLSHAAVIGREYGIPAVLNIDNISSLIKNGMIIRVDGDAGTVTIIKEAK